MINVLVKHELDIGRMTAIIQLPPSGIAFCIQKRFVIAFGLKNMGEFLTRFNTRPQTFLPPKGSDITACHHPHAIRVYVLYPRLIGSFGPPFFGAIFLHDIFTDLKLVLHLLMGGVAHKKRTQQMEIIYVFSWNAAPFFPEILLVPGLCNISPKNRNPRPGRPYLRVPNFHRTFLHCLPAGKLKIYPSYAPRILESEICVRRNTFGNKNLRDILYNGKDLDAHPGHNSHAAKPSIHAP